MWGDEDDLSPHHQAGAPGRPQPVHAARLQLRPAHTCQEAALPPQQGQDRVRGEAGAVLGRRDEDGDEHRAVLLLQPRGATEAADF